jgi:hypothetical protein
LDRSRGVHFVTYLFPYRRQLQRPNRAQARYTRPDESGIFLPPQLIQSKTVIFNRFQQAPTSDRRWFGTRGSEVRILSPRPILSQTFKKHLSGFYRRLCFLDIRFNLTTELLEQNRKLVKCIDDEFLPLANRMWVLLSQRGNPPALVLRDLPLAGELEPVADVPTWTQWYEAFSTRIKNAPSLRTLQRKLKKPHNRSTYDTNAESFST